MKRSDFIAKYKKELKDRNNELMNYMENRGDLDLIMMYWYCLDPIQHALFKNKLIIMDFYLKFNEFVGKLKKKLSDDDIILILSDHGQEKGIHTAYGFYSCNKKLGLKNPKIIDFKRIIEKDLMK